MLNMHMIKAKDLAQKWHLTSRRIGQLCAEGMIPGAVKQGRCWMIPADVKKPDVLQKTGSKEGFRKSTTALLPCSVGITSYKEASTECYYVDKTRLIKELIDEHSKVFLFTRPRRFGKTLTMDMVKTFFEISESDTSVYFKGREIWGCGDEYKRYQGAYPVIYISFKDAHQKTWEDMLRSLKFTIKNEFRRHNELLSGTALTESDKKYFNRILDMEADEIEYQAALGELSYMLSAHYATKTIIIIDEYDTPIQQGYSNGYYEQTTQFMRNFFSAGLKDNANLEFGILTGILRVAKESLFSGLNNLVVNSILDEKYDEYFGFTEAEVRKMADYYGKADKMGEIRYWYDGYRFGSREIYNPWSVISYFNNNCKAKAFWSRTSENDVISELLRHGSKEMSESLTDLLQDKEVSAEIDTDIIYPEIEGNQDSVYSFLLVAGYLKISNYIAEMDDRQFCGLLIPNKEVKAVFRKEILDNLSMLFSKPTVRNCQLALRTQDSELLKDTLRAFLLQSAGSPDLTHENFYHGMMLGLLAIMSEDYLIRSNRESGEGRFDIQMEPRMRTMPGVIMEFKVGKDYDQEKLEKLSKEAVKQMIDKKYTVDMAERGVKEIQLYGIAFSGKNVSVETESHHEI